MPPGFPTSTMLRSFQGVLGATDPRKILKMDEGMKGRFCLKTFRVFFCEDPFGMYLVGLCRFMFLDGWFLFVSS